MWAKKVSNFISAAYPETKELLAWVANQAGSITPLILAAEYGAGADEIIRIIGLDDIDSQVYTVLLHLTELTANDIVANTDGGVEAWRRLSARFDPMTGTRVRNLLRSILQPTRVNMESVEMALEKWEELVGKYRRGKDNAGHARHLPDDIAIAGVEALVPAEIEQHLQLNSARLFRYALVRAEIIAFTETRAGGSV